MPRELPLILLGLLAIVGGLSVAPGRHRAGVRRRWLGMCARYGRG